MYIGDNQINKAYMGDAGVIKMYLGDALVYDASGPGPTPVGGNYLTISGDSSDYFNITLSGTAWDRYDAPYLEYSYDAEYWEQAHLDVWNPQASIDFGEAGKFYLRGSNSNGLSRASGAYVIFSSLNEPFAVSGNIMTLIDYEEPPMDIPNNYCFYKMFYNQSLVSAPELPATGLTDSCYQYMFYGCTSLITAPELPATTLTKNCYNTMFYDCTSLTTAPELPATTLTTSCYQYMFRNCTNLSYIKCLTQELPYTNCTTDWVRSVSTTGTFVAANADVPWTSGNNGVPDGWSVEYAE